MERTLDRLEERLKALDGALRLRGVWNDPLESDRPGEGTLGGPSPLRLRVRRGEPSSEA